MYIVHITRTAHTFRKAAMEPWLWPDYRSLTKWLTWFIVVAALVGAIDPWTELLSLLLVYAGIVALALTVVAEAVIYQLYHLPRGTETTMEEHLDDSTREIPTVTAIHSLPPQPDHAPTVHRRHTRDQAAKDRIAALNSGLAKVCYTVSSALMVTATVMLIMFPEEWWWQVLSIAAAVPLLYVVINLALLLGSGTLRWFTTGGFRQWRAAARYQREKKRNPQNYPAPVRSTYRWIPVQEGSDEFYRERPPASRFVRSVTSNLIIWLVMAIAVQMIFHPDPFVSTYVQVWISLINAYLVQRELLFWYNTSLVVISQRIGIELDESLFFLVRGASGGIQLSTLVDRTPQGRTVLEFLVFKQRRTIELVTQASATSKSSSTARQRRIPVLEAPPFYQDRGEIRIIHSVIDAHRFIEATYKADEAREKGL